MKRRQVHLLLLMMLLTGALSRQVHAVTPQRQPLAPATALEASPPLAESVPDEKIPEGTTITPVSEASPLSQPLPAPDLAEGDAAPGGWASYHGTRGGQLFMTPRSPTYEFSPQGPAIGIGSWRTSSPLLSTNHVNALAGSDDGRVFAAISGQGLYVYDGNASGAYSWTAIPAGANGPIVNAITDLAIFDGGLWVGTSGSGISVMSLTTGAWTHYNTANTANLSGNYIGSLTPVDPPTGNNYIWVGTDGGASRYTVGRPGTWAKYTNSNIDDGVTDIAVQFVGATTYTWFSTSSQMVRWNGSIWSQITGGGQCVTTGPMRSTHMVVDQSNALWFGMEENVPGDVPDSPDGTASPQVGYWVPAGVCRIFGANWNKFNSTSPGLPNTKLSDIDLDGAGRIWMGFNGSEGGAASYDHGRWEIYKIANGDPLRNDNISQIEAIGEAVWFGHNSTSTFDIYSANWDNLTAAEMGSSGSPGALLVESSTTWLGIGTSLAWYTSSWSDLAIPGNGTNINALARDGDGTLWIATNGSGLFSFNGVSTFTRLTTANGIPSNTVRDLLKDQDGRLWISTPAGLALKGDNYWLRFNQANSPIISDNLSALTIDPSGRIWAGTLGSGIAIFNPKPDGGWSSQTTANGLPSNTIRDLLTEPSGAIWAATDGGVARWSPSTNSWTSYTSAGLLPSNQTLSLATDGAGTIWVGTADGIGQLKAGVWKQHHVPGSALQNNSVRAVAADTKRLWAISGTSLSVRGPPDIPIGNFVPTISSFTPTQGGPFTQVTITGNHFDNRGPEFNRVTILNSSLVAEILSATTTQLVIKIPALAQSGKLRVEANGLGSTWSTATFTVVPVVTKVSASCLGVGSTLEIEGYGFTSGNGIYVQIGNGPWAVADYWDPTWAKRVILPTDQSGVIKVRTGSNGPIVTTSFSLNIATLSVQEINIQQGIEDLRMIWGKRTMVQVLPKATGCNTRLTGGRVYWKKKNGTEVKAGTAYFTSPEGLQVKTNPSSLSLNTSVNFVAEFMSNRSHWEQPFPMSQFDGLRIVLVNGWQDVLTINIPETSLIFVDTTGKRRLISMGIYPKSGPNNFDFDDAKWAGWQDVARVYPMQDVYWGPWLNDIATWTSFDYVYLDDDSDVYDDNYSDVRDMAADYVEPGGNKQSMALVDWDLYKGGPSGKATLGSPAAVTFNHPDAMAQIYLQEAIHNLDWVDDDSPNHDDANEYHSRYDEGEWDDYGDCVSSKNFRRALENQMGSVKKVYRLDSGDPYEFSMVGCGKGDKMPKSAMSYVTGGNNDNVFLEPVDYDFVLDEICDGSCPNSFFSFDAQDVQATQVVTPARSFRLSGAINSANVVTTSLSLVEDPGLLPSEPEAGGVYHLVLRAANNAVLHDHAFNLDGDHTHGGAPSSSYFHIRVPFPDGAVSAELRHDNAVIWSDSVSTNAPSVSFISPNGGTHSAGGPIAISWSASDADADTLQFALEYSADGGATWELIAPKLSGNSFNWIPGFTPASANARLRIRASDGFNTASALSAPFTLSAKAPEAIIETPGPGQIFTEGQVVQLSGGSLTSSGQNQGSFLWWLGASLIGNARSISTTLQQPGTFTVTFRVTANSMQSSDAVSITVLADYDRDGMPNSWEQSYELNPLDPYNAAGDPDADGLTNLQEYQFGTNPIVSDSDGDLTPDGAEVQNGNDPTLSQDKPESGPVLQVGAETMGFDSTAEQPYPAPWKIWITNGGTGSLSWSASDDAAWLQLSSPSGVAPSQLSISVNPGGLAIGSYTGHITITAPGAADSPQTITVTLDVTAELPAGKAIYLPLLIRQ